MNDYVRELCEQHDRMMAEAEASGHWVPSKGQWQPPVRKKADVAHETASAPVYTEPDPAFVEAIGRVIGEERARAREARAKETAEIAELRGQVSALLALLGRKDESKVVDLPKLAWERDRA